MQKEQLKKYLANQPLVQAIRQKSEINETHKKLHEARRISEETGLDKDVVGAIAVKCNEYIKIYKAYGGLLEDAWGITWQNEEIIKRYIDCADAEIEKLPNEIKNI